MDNYEIPDNKRFWKVITVAASGKGGDGFGTIIISSPNQIHTDSYFSFQVNSENEAKSLKAYLESNFANSLLSAKKITQNISSKMLEYIPLVPFDREWTDELIFKHFEFSDDQIKAITDMY